MAANKKKSYLWPQKNEKTVKLQKKQSKMASCEKNGFVMYFSKIKTFLFLYLICLLFDLQTRQIILPDPALQHVNFNMLCNNVRQFKLSSKITLSKEIHFN